MELEAIPRSDTDSDPWNYMTGKAARIMFQDHGVRNGGDHTHSHPGVHTAKAALTDGKKLRAPIASTARPMVK